MGVSKVGQPWVPSYEERAPSFGWMVEKKGCEISTGNQQNRLKEDYNDYGLLNSHFVTFCFGL